MPGIQRWMLVLAGCGLMILLLTAAALPPDPTGYGTHRRLGLPPCTMVALYGIRCPACGMTTSWSCLMRGEWMRALQANAGGFLMGLLAVAASPWLLASAARGRWWIGCPNEWLILGTGLLLVVVTLGDWVVRIYR
jgi:hypothetical protein